MDNDQIERLIVALNRVAAATLATSVIRTTSRTSILKEAQVAFNDCYMIVNPAEGTKTQTEFQERIDKKEW